MKSFLNNLDFRKERWFLTIIFLIPVSILCHMIAGILFMNYSPELSITCLSFFVSYTLTYLV